MLESGLEILIFFSQSTAWKHTELKQSSTLEWLVGLFTLLQARHSGGVPEHFPPKEREKQEPEVGPDLGGPV